MIWNNNGQNPKRCPHTQKEGVDFMQIDMCGDRLLEEGALLPFTATQQWSTSDEQGLHLTDHTPEWDRSAQGDERTVGECSNLWQSRWRMTAACSH